MFVFMIIILLIIMLICTRPIKGDIKAASINSEKLKSEYDKLIVLGCDSKSQIGYVGFSNIKREIKIKPTMLSEYIIKYDDIVGIELIENGKTTLCVGNIIGGAVLAGGVGAILGGINKKQEITSMQVKFSIEDFFNPSYSLEMLNNGLRLNNSTKEENIKNIRLDATQIIDTVKYIIGNKC